MAAAEKIIVGVDSGTTKAVALLSLSEFSWETYSEKNVTFAQICRFISERGIPVIVASDRKKSKMARRLAAAFNAKLVNPENDLSIREKNFLTNNLKTKNRHEKDALAAALHARNEHIGLFEKIDRRVPQHSADVKELLLKRRAANISEAVKQLIIE